MISFQQVHKIFPSSTKPAVDRVSLNLQAGEIFVLLGSSGSGKTTLMKMINRLVEPTSGQVIIDDRPVQAYPISQLRRRIGYVFQGLGLFPHMTVAENITVVLRLQGQSRTQRQQRADVLLDMMHLARHYASRYPYELSGGEQQRVAVARALAADPDYVLMDEPFAALDAITRAALQHEILALNKTLGKTIVFVTHDLNEAFMIADRIGVLHQGKLQQLATPEALKNNPETEFVKTLLQPQFGVCNELNGR